ncbi:Putative B3 domain-containing protein REM15 [Linum perenne]
MAEMGNRIINNKPHFFQPLLPGFHNDFSIPVEFGKYLVGREENAVMRSPGGKIYRVKMKERKFEDGWKEFVDEHDLHVGDLLLFRLVDAAEMTFQVMVFDPAASERPYPCNKVDVKAEQIESPLHQCPDISDPPQTRRDLNSGTPMRKIGNDKDSPAPAMPVYPYFVVSVTTDHLERGRLRFPSNFSKIHGLELTNSEAVVYNEQGRTWPVRINYYSRSSRSTYLERGWKAFQWENGLKLGDTFNLELVKGGQEPVFRVSGLNSNPTLEKQYREKVRKKVKKESLYQEPSASRFPKNVSYHFFVSVTSPQLQGDTVRIPMELAKYCGLSGEHPIMILTNGNGGHWQVTVETRNNGGAYIGRGWTELVNDNNLCVGDLLRMELVERGISPMMMFKVVLRKKDVPKQEKMS